MDLRATTSNSRDLLQLHNAQITTTKEIRKQFESHNNHTYGNSQHTAHRKQKHTKVADNDISAAGAASRTSSIDV
jgi:hypothetical protein